MSTGNFNPSGVLWHHTGTTTSTAKPCPTLALCVNGRKDLPGPLCHVVIGYDGVCHIIAAGRANHAGIAKASGSMPKGDGNELYVGFELDYDGTQKPSTAQVDAAQRGAAAVMKRLSKDANKCRGHKETSVTGKWDPGQVDLNSWRSKVSSRLAYKPPAPDQGDDWMAASDVWEVPMGKSGIDMGVAMQRIYTWMEQMNKKMTDLEAKLDAQS
jgi:hypothetical protein